MAKGEFTVKEIGRVRSPYQEQTGTPIQPGVGDPLEAEVIIRPEFREGLSDLERFGRIWLVSWFDRSQPYRMKVIPYRDTVERGLFATRAPSRPNPVGISAVELLSVDAAAGRLRVRGVDLLDNTPILDIKPYVPEFDSHPNEAAGWLDEGLSTRSADDRFSRGD